MRRSLPIAIRYYRSLPNHRVAGYLLAIFLMFGAAGFIGDAMHAPLQRPWQGAQVLASVTISGAIAVLFALSSMRSWWFLPFAVAVMVVGMHGLDVMWQASDVGWAAAPAGFEAIQHRLTMDGRLATVSLLLGFILLVRFIRTEGIRQTRLRAEMELAEAIHESLVPDIALEGHRFEVRGRSLPSSEVGGDLVDAFEHDGSLVACVVDVAGHGVPAGTLMAMMKSALRLRLPAREGLDIVLADLNRLLIEMRRPERFVTLACMRFDGRGAAEYVLAGHLPILRIGPGGLQRLDNQSLPLGIQEGAAFAVRRVEVASGDLFAIFTDGLSEIRDAAGREFGMERLEWLLVERAGRSLTDLHRLIIEAVGRHGRQLDDETLLLIRAR
jgi:hypothetical protein